MWILVIFAIGVRPTPSTAIGKIEGFRSNSECFKQAGEVETTPGIFTQCTKTYEEYQTMAHWKELTDITGPRVQVNMDYVIYMHYDNEKTTVFFVGGPNKNGKTRYLEVKESPEQIPLFHPLRSF